jgi:hypothetical protein
MQRTLWTLSAGLVLGLFLGTAAAADPDSSSLPRFTEEREAAALFFVRKNLPELMPLLDGLRKNNLALYEQEIREIFQVTEMLADLRDDMRRHDLELRIWKCENRANLLLARLSTPSDEERRKAEEQLQEVARELVDLDMQVLELKAEQLDKELGELKDELSKMRDNLDKHSRDRFEAILDRAKKPKK